MHLCVSLVRFVRTISNDLCSKQYKIAPSFWVEDRIIQQPQKIHMLMSVHNNRLSGQQMLLYLVPPPPSTLVRHTH